MAGAMPPQQAFGFCRAILPRVSRTFALNMRLLNGSLGEAVRVAYLLCRAADALEDSWPGQPAQIRHRFGRLLTAVAGDDDAAATLAGDAARLGGRRSEEHTSELQSPM